MDDLSGLEGTKEFRYHWYPAGDQASLYQVHADPCRWSGIVYLSENEDTVGTRFFKHRETGLAEIPSALELSWFALERGLSPSAVTKGTTKGTASFS